MGPEVGSWLQDCLQRAQQTLPSHRKPSYRNNETLQCERYCTQTTSQAMECSHNIWKSWKIHKSSIKSPNYLPQQLKIILKQKSKTKKPSLLLTKPPFFSLLCIGTLTEKDTSHHESVLFHVVLKAYPTCHSLIITDHHISLGNLIDIENCTCSTIRRH